MSKHFSHSGDDDPKEIMPPVLEKTPPVPGKLSAGDQKTLDKLQGEYADLKAQTEKATGEKLAELLKQKGAATKQLNDFKAAHGIE